MNRLFSIILVFFIGTLLFPEIKASETLNYVVTYKWGLIHKDAGDVTITKNDKGQGYELKLIAKSKPWADRIYKVRDTLVSVTKREKYAPLSYTYIAHEKNKYKKDEIKFEYSGSTVTGKAHKYREKNGEITESETRLEGILPVYDMLSVYFFLRDIDYSLLKPGETMKATIFSGDKTETLTVKCEGKEMVKMYDKTEKEAWHIQFKFTSGGGKKSSDDINCWISTDHSRIPLLIVGNLPIGQVRVLYKG